MINFIIFLSFIITSCIVDVNSQFTNCDYKWKLNNAGDSVTLNFPGSGTSAGSPCRYQVISPPDTFMRATCKINIAGTEPSCSSQRFFISRSGDMDARDSPIYCGSKTVTIQSIGNEFIMGLKSVKTGSGTFSCSISAVSQTRDNCDCGWSPNMRILGGTTTGVNEYVSHVGFIDTSTSQYVNFCGGIIISQYFIISAGHCFKAYPYASKTVALVGDHDKLSSTDTIWSALYTIQGFMIHPSFNSDNNNNDIAIVKTNNYIKFNLGVGPACLPYVFMNNNPYFDGKYLNAVGWGSKEFGTGPEMDNSILQKVSLAVIATATCQKSAQFVIDSKICTYGGTYRDTCQRDSGSGLYYLAGRQYAIGIVSYGVYCGSTKPSVNTRITSFVGWIENTIGSTFLCRKQ